MAVARNRLMSVAWPVVAVASLVTPSLLHAAVLPRGFDEFPVTPPIPAGTAIEFAPDGKLFVLQKPGTMQVYQGSGANEWVQVAPSGNFFTGQPLNVWADGESGLLGIAFDPGYLKNRYLYVHYIVDSPRRNRISRFTANAAGTQVIPGSEAVIMNLDPTTASHHVGGGLRFGPDGKLYASVGDHNVPVNAQSITNRFGKILRLNPDPANPIPKDNPSSISGIAGATAGDNRAIWAAGLRNPFRFAFKPGTSVMFINDVGDDVWEEINAGAAGANYRWPWEGPFNQSQFPQFTAPIVYYHHSLASHSHPPQTGFLGRCITGGAFYVPPATMFPAEYIGDYFFADFTDHWIRRYDPLEKAVHEFASNAGALVDLCLGPDAALYYLQYGGRVFRVRYIAPCCADVAPIGGDGMVNVNDLLAVINSWGPCDPNCIWPCPADTNGDCTVNVADLLAVINAWGPCP